MVILLNKKHVDALRIKSGPSESGFIEPPPPVGGDVLLSDKLSLLLSNFWPVIALLMLTLGYLLYSRKHKIIKFLWKLK